jgi:hypothetical protein
MDIWRILSSSFSYIKKNPKFILPHLFECFLDVIVFLPFLAIFIFTWKGMYQPDAFYISALLIFGMLLMVLVSLFLNACARAAVIGMAKEGYGNKVALRTGWESAKKFGPEIFGYFMFLILGAAILMFIALVPILFDRLFITLFLVLFFGLGLLILYLLVLFAPQQIVIEEKGIIKGIIGSARFVRANIGAVLLYIALVIGINISTGLLSFILSFPALLFGQDLGYIFSKGMQNFIAWIIWLVVAPYLEIVKTMMIIQGK